MKHFEFLLVLLFPALPQAEVTVFTTCPQFFLTVNGHTVYPTVFTKTKYKQICQRYNNCYEFATLYDTGSKIPVYSAYVYRGNENCNRKSTWFIEPQLDDNNGAVNMAPESSVNKNLLGVHQAVNADYVGSDYDKGHLYPVFHTCQQCSADSTFTLTNAAPQDPTLNRGQWRVMEAKVAAFLNTHCTPYQAYMVTGVVPGTGKIGSNVNVPSYFWSSFCCVDNNGKHKYSAGFIAANNNNPVTNVAIADLEKWLNGVYGHPPSFSLFGGVC